MIGKQVGINLEKQKKDVKKIWVSGMDHNFAGNVPITIDGVKYDSYIDYIFTQTRN